EVQGGGGLFAGRFRYHQTDAVPAKDRHPEVTDIINPQKRATQFVTRTLQRMAGMRYAGFVLVESKWRSRWSPPTFALEGQGVVEHEAPPETPETPETSGLEQAGASVTDVVTILKPQKPQNVFDSHARDAADEGAGEGAGEAQQRPADLERKHSGVSGVSGISAVSGHARDPSDLRD